MSEHSTGPWTVDGRYDVIDANGYDVASPDLVWHSNAEAEANARLMAAAPSLYDALTALVAERADQVCDHECCAPERVLLDTAREALKAAQA